MKSKSTEYRRQIKKVVARGSIAYAGAIGVIAVALVISAAHGSGWRPALAGMPLYVILFVGITYQLVKKLIALRKQEREATEKVK